MLICSYIRMLTCLFVPVSVRDSDLCIPIRSGGFGRPRFDVSERPVCGERPGVSSAARREESDSSSGTPDQKTGGTRPPVHVRGRVHQFQVSAGKLKMVL